MDITDRPMTRSRRKELESAGYTPALLTPDAAAAASSKSAVKCSVTKDLFKSAGHAGVDDVQATSSPVDQWVNAESDTLPDVGSPEAVPSQMASNPETPQASPLVAQAGADSVALSPQSPFTRMLGPTPNNTPAAGLPGGRIEVSLIQQAVQDLNDGSLSFTPHPVAPQTTPALAAGGAFAGATPSLVDSTPGLLGTVPAAFAPPPSALDTPPLLTPAPPASLAGSACSVLAAAGGSTAAVLSTHASAPTTAASALSARSCGDLALDEPALSELLDDLDSMSVAKDASEPQMALSPISAAPPLPPPADDDEDMTEEDLAFLHSSPALPSEQQVAASYQGSAAPSPLGLWSSTSPGPSPATTPGAQLSSLSSPPGTLQSLPGSVVCTPGYTSVHTPASMLLSDSECATGSTLAVAPLDAAFGATPPSAVALIRAEEEHTPPTETVSPGASWTAASNASLAAADAASAADAAQQELSGEASFAFSVGAEAPQPEGAAGVDDEDEDEEMCSPELLQHNGMDDDLPTPDAFVPPGARAPVAKSPSTPEEQQVKAFGISAGSCFATPEVPIHTGMTAFTTAETRAAARHIPAWHRISQLVRKESPAVHTLVEAMWAEPALQHWAITPWKLLEGVCRGRGWQLTMRPATDAKLASSVSTMATVQIPEGQGLTVVGNGKCQGQLESLIVAAAAALEQLLARQLVHERDVRAVAALASLPPPPQVSTLGRTPRPRAGAVPAPPAPAFGRSVAVPAPAAARSKPLTPVPATPAAEAAAEAAAAIAQLTPVAALADSDIVTNAVTAGGRDIMAPTPEHPGVGVRLPADLPPAPTPEMRELPLKAKSKNSSAGATPPVKRPTALTELPVSPNVVFHPPFRTGKSSVAHKGKATLAATAKPTGLAAIKAHQAELERAAKQSKDTIAALTERLGGVKLDASKRLSPLKGVPLPQGSHTVFDEAGVAVSVRRATALRGIPRATGTHKHFDSDDDAENVAGY